MVYKKSIFNVIKEVEANQSYILYNTFTGGVAILNDEELSLYENPEDNNTELHNIELINVFVENGFYVKKHFDEICCLINRYDKARCDSTKRVIRMDL